MPHCTLLVLFTTSAQTHIFPEIRIDAIRILDILLGCVPESVTAGWNDRNERHGSRVLSGYLGILSAGTKYGDGDGGEFSKKSVQGSCCLHRLQLLRQPASSCHLQYVSISPFWMLRLIGIQSKLTVLRSLTSFLHICLSSLEGTTSAQDDDAWDKPLDAWFMGGGFSSPEALQSYEKLFTPEYQSRKSQCIHCHWQERIDPLDKEGYQFVDHFPLLHASAGESWTLNDLSLLDLSNSEDHHWSSQSSCSGFVAVSFGRVSFQIRCSSYH